MKSEKLIIETPEKIIFSYSIAEIGSRIAAYLIDVILQLLILLLLFLVFGLGFLSVDGYDGDQYLYYIAIIYILFFLFQWGYFLFFETILNGKTPGKQVCHIRVIRFDGDRLDFQCLVIRNLLRAADSIPIPFFNILGGLVANINKQNKRIGDMAAGTVVVKDTLYKIAEPDFETNIADKHNRLFASPAAKSRLTEKDLNILRRLINERKSMSADAEKKTYRKIVDKLKSKYDLSQIKDKSDFEIIEEIYKAHTYENEE